MKNICYLLATMFLNENGKTGHQNVYVSVKGKFILSKVANRICQDYGFQKVVVLYRTEVTKMELKQTLLKIQRYVVIVYPK